MDRRETKMRHFILVHGMCHGAWCWYKVASMLKSAGHRVTAVDLAGSGVDPRRIEELRSFAEYSQPLMDAMAAAVDGRERAIVVGHSLGGLSIALAMQKFPQNVAAAVFVAAVMPSSSNPMSCIAKEVRYSFVALIYIYTMCNECVVRDLDLTRSNTYLK